MPVRTPLLAVVPALLIAAAVLGALWRPWVRAAVWRPAWAGALALAAAYIASDRFVWNGWPGLWSVEEQRRLPLVAVVALGMAVGDSLGGGRIGRSWLAWQAGAMLIAPIVWV